MSFLLHWSTYFFSTTVEAIKLGLLVAIAFEPVDGIDEDTIANGPEEIRQDADIAFDESLLEAMLLAAVPAAQEAEIELNSTVEEVIGQVLNGLFESEPLMEVVAWLVDEPELNFVMGDPLDELRPIMMVELNFARHAVPDLTLEQKRRVWNAAEACLKRAVDQAAHRNNPANGPIGFMPVRPFVPRESLSQAIAGELKQILPADRFEQFADRADKRHLRRKTAAILGIVSRLDGELYLSQSQREQLIAAISSNCGPGWVNRADTLDWQEDPLDGIPEAVISSCLNEAQLSAWKSLQESHPFEMISAGEFEPVDDGWWSAPGPSDEPTVPLVVPNEQPLKSF